MAYCDCEDDGREAFKWSRHSYETEERLRAAKYGYGDECDEEFRDGYRAEERREETRREEEEAEERAYERARRERAEQERYDAEQFERFNDQFR